ATPAERAAYLKLAAAERRAANGDGEEEEITLTNEEVGDEAVLSPERYEELKANEQFILTVSTRGFGKRSSSYEFRTAGRGGKGIRATDTSDHAQNRIGKLVATFPVDDADQLMLVSDGGQVIRVPVDQISFKSRTSMGVTI